MLEIEAGKRIDYSFSTCFFFYFLLLAQQQNFQQSQQQQIQRLLRNTANQQRVMTPDQERMRKYSQSSSYRTLQITDKFLCTGKTTENP